MILTRNTRFVLRDGVVHIAQREDGEEVDGVELKGIMLADVHYRPDDVVTASIDLCDVCQDTDAHPYYFMRHPVTGERVEIAKITFADGSEFKC